MSNKRVLVLMSTYNGDKYVEEQIRSIMQQESEYDIDLRIRDDGSNDGTCQTITEMQREYPGRIELIRGERIGCNASFFHLLNDAEGYKYYALSDQDDVWLPNKVQVACEHLDKENSDSPLLFASTSYLVGDDLKPYGKTRTKLKEFSIYNTIIQNICPGHTQVMNNALLELVRGDIDTSKIYVYDSWITNMAVLCGKVLFSNDSFSYYRQHKMNQLGSGVGGIGQLLTSSRRTKSGDGKKYRRQIEHFIIANEEKLAQKGFIKELNAFVDAHSFLDRLRYVTRSKLCRQSRLETIAFDLAVLAGKF